MQNRSQRKLKTFLFYSLFLLLTQHALPLEASPLNHSILLSDTSQLLGKWDITVDVDGKSSPSWLEVRHSGYRTLVGRFVGISGSARPVSRIYLQNGTMSLSIPPQWEEEDRDIQIAGVIKGDSLVGIMTFSNGKRHSWVGKRAPSLVRANEPQWGTPIALFDGSNMEAWKASGVNQWVVESGVLRSPKSGSNLITKEKFEDFKLHLEFRYPKGSNSGAYLRGRYEVQIIDSKGEAPDDLLFGGVYGYLTPSEMAAKAAGEWQTYDITFVGRMVTIVANGKTIISNQAIPGITGGALDSNEGEPGPIMLQGDHGPVDFRSIILTPAQK